MKNEKSGHATTTIINAEEGPHFTVVGIKSPIRNFAEDDCFFIMMPSMRAA